MRKTLYLIPRVFLVMVFLCGVAISGESNVVIHFIRFDDRGTPTEISGELLFPKGAQPDLRIHHREQGDTLIALKLKKDSIVDAGNGVVRARFTVDFIEVLRSVFGKPGDQWELCSLKGSRAAKGLEIPREGVQIYKDELFGVFLTVAED